MGSKVVPVAGAQRPSVGHFSVEHECKANATASFMISGNSFIGISEFKIKY
jgi:hypothetical protein